MDNIIRSKNYNNYLLVLGMFHKHLDPVKNKV